MACSYSYKFICSYVPWEKACSNWLQVPAPELLQPFDASKMPYNAIADLWADAQMEEVLRYLYGNSHLKLPEEWKCLFPSEVK